MNSKYFKELLHENLSELNRIKRAIAMLSSNCDHAKNNTKNILENIDMRDKL